jgi:hypothetical protein
MKHLLLSTVAALALSVPAFAADIGAVPDYVEAPVSVPAPAWAAYLDIHGGYGFGDESGDTDFEPLFSDYDEDWDEWNIGGALRAAYFFSPAFSLQGDIWVNHWDGDGDGTSDLGRAGHAVRRLGVLRLDDVQQ